MTAAIHQFAINRTARSLFIVLSLASLPRSISASEGASSDSRPSPVTTRVWTDSSGQYRVEARLVIRTEDSLVLDTTDGRRVTVPISRLSRDDQRYLDQSFPDSTAEAAQPLLLRYENPSVSKVRIGMEVTAQQSACNNLVATFPLPMSWPEQKAEILEEDISPLAQRLTKRVLNDGVQQVEFRVPRLAAGESAHVIYTMRVERFQILPPETPHALVFTRKRNGELRQYLSASPLIEIDHAKVKAAADEIQLDENKSAWVQVESIYDWTRNRVSKHDGTKPLQGALYALETKSGDCEEITSLFVAMCRLKGIPARCVWVDHHTYPEFYLEDPTGRGLWMPCESLGARNFGGVNCYRLLLQKGDNFRMAQKQGAQRYVTPTISGTVGPGGSQPVMREILEQERAQ